MQDGSHWQLSRLYSDFYDFQIALLTEFPDEAGNTGRPRTLPFMPGPVTYVTDVISNGRQQNLDEYIQKMLKMPAHISRCHLIRQLFAPRDGDVEVGRNGSTDDFQRLSGASQQSSNDSPEDMSQQSSRQNLNGNGYQPGLSAPPPRPNQQQFAQAGSNGLPQSAPSTQSMVASNADGSGVGPLKIKVYFSDEIIAIRVPMDITFDRLRDKLKDRLLVGDDLAIQYKDEPTNEYHDMRGDGDLDVALQRNPKLTLYVSVE